MLISLVGMPGSGKSTVGRQLARMLGWRFLDSDAEIERHIGGSIRSLFEQQGEDAFRDLEQATLADLVRSHAAVLATGGGSVLREANRAALRAGGKVVYLRSSPEDLFRRLRHDRQRPLLQVADPQKRLRELFQQRDPLYRDAADFVIETGRPTVATLVNMILMQLELAGVLPPAAPPALPTVAAPGEAPAPGSAGSPTTG